MDLLPILVNQNYQMMTADASRQRIQMFRTFKTHIHRNYVKMFKLRTKRKQVNSGQDCVHYVHCTVILCDEMANLTVETIARRWTLHLSETIIKTYRFQHLINGQAVTKLIKFLSISGWVCKLGLGNLKKQTALTILNIKKRSMIA